MQNKQKVYTAVRNLLNGRETEEDIEATIDLIREDVEACGEGYTPVVHLYTDTTRVTCEPGTLSNYALLFYVTEAEALDAELNVELNSVLEAALDEAGAPSYEESLEILGMEDRDGVPTPKKATGAKAKEESATDHGFIPLTKKPETKPETKPAPVNLLPADAEHDEVVGGRQKTNKDK